MRFSLDSITLNYRKVGQGPHLSFLHGFCEHAGLWDPLVEQLQNDYTCLTIDLPGFGESPITSNYSMTELAQCILALWQAEGIDRSVVLGHSMGGYVGLEMLAQDPRSIRALGLIHSTALADSAEKKASRQKVIDFLERQPARLFLEQFYTQLVAPEHLHELKDELWTLVKDSPAEAIIAATRAMINRNDHRSTMQDNPIPYLFLTGDKDAHFTAEDIYRQASKCQVAEVALIPGSGHLSLLEEPQKSRAIIVDFLKFVDQVDQ